MEITQTTKSPNLSRFQISLIKHRWWIWRTLYLIPQIRDVDKQVVLFNNSNFRLFFKFDLLEDTQVHCSNDRTIGQLTLKYRQSWEETGKCFLDISSIFYNYEIHLFFWVSNFFRNQKNPDSPDRAADKTAPNYQKRNAGENHFIYLFLQKL